MRVLAAISFDSCSDTQNPCPCCRSSSHCSTDIRAAETADIIEGQDGSVVVGCAAEGTCSDGKAVCIASRCVCGNLHGRQQSAVLGTCCQVSSHRRRANQCEPLSFG